jgi:hypothetical protein
MILTSVVPDSLLGAAGFEHHIFRCSACHETQRQRVLTKNGRESGPEPISVIPGYFPRLIARERRSQDTSDQSEPESHDDLRA